MFTNHKRKLLSLLAILPILSSWFFTGTASAGPWATERGHSLVISRLDYYQSQQAAVDTTFTQIASATYGEIGLGNQFTLGTNLIYVNQYSDSDADPFAAEGFSTAELFLQKNIWEKANAVLALRGTYAAGSSLQRFGASGVTAQNERDEAIEFAVSYGRNLDEQGSKFLAMDAGYRRSLGKDADQIGVDMTLGFKPAKKWLLLAKSLNDFAVTEADATGIDYDISRLEASAVYQLTQHYDIELGASQEISGRNINKGNAIFLSLWSRF